MYFFRRKQTIWFVDQKTELDSRQTKPTVVDTIRCGMMYELGACRSQEVTDVALLQVLCLTRFTYRPAELS